MSGQISRGVKKSGIGKAGKSIMYGVVGGIGSPKLVYSNENLSDLEGDFLIKPDFGIFAEIPFSNSFSVSPELMLMNKGTNISYEYGQKPGGGSYTVGYDVNSMYISLRIPFMFRFSIAGNHNMQPFVFAAPDVSYCIGGEISSSQEGLPNANTSIDIGNANMREVDAGIIVGAGYRCMFRAGNCLMFIRFDLGYNFGFVNSFSDKELAGNSTSANINAYNGSDLGKRYNRGFEFSVHIGIPKTLKIDNCDEPSRFYRKKPITNKSKYMKGKDFGNTD